LADRVRVCRGLSATEPTEAAGSTPGWTDRARQQVTSDDIARTRVSRRPIDLQTNELVYDESDPWLGRVQRPSAPIDAERSEAFVEVVRDEFLADPTAESVLLRELVGEHGFDSHVVKRSFDRLEADGTGEQIYVVDVGLAPYV
jgi:hypothetical protein